MARTILLLLLLGWLKFVECQNDIESDLQGFITVSDTSKLKVVLDCGAKFMTVHLTFNGSITPTFSRWIVVGTVNDPQCMKQGNGQLQYIVELPLTNDPCGTRMIESGRFENKIRIGDLPGVVLENDENILIRCVYGRPEVGTAVVPFLPQTESFESAHTDFPPLSQNPQTPVRSSGSVKKKPALAVGYVYLIVFLILFLALLFLICGGLYFFLKRRKLRLERRKRLLVAVPPGSELSKLGLSHLWWSGKSGVTNDALLSHDYMIATNSNREGGLSVSTDYPGSSPSTSTGSPDEGQVAHTGAAYNNQAFAGDSKGARTQHINQNTKKITQSDEVTINTTSYSAWRQEETAKYAQVEVHRKKANNNNHNADIDLDEVELAASRSHISSVSHMYRPKPDPPSPDIMDDRGSDSTLEGKTYYTPQESEHSSRWSPQEPIPLEIHAQHLALSKAERQLTEEFIRVIEEQDGSGPRKLTQVEKQRWRQLVETDANVQEMLVNSRTSEDFERICKQPQYAPLFPADKWAIIAAALASVSFMRRLNNIIDTTDGAQANQHQRPGSGIGHRYLKKVETDAQPRKVSPAEVQAMQTVEEVGKQQASVASIRQKLEKRIFTRESYARVKQEMEESFSSDEGPGASRDCSTTEFTEGLATVPSDEPPDHPPPPPPTSEPPLLHAPGIYEAHAVHVMPAATSSGGKGKQQQQPTLNVYMGNLPERGLPRGVSLSKPPYPTANIYDTSSTTAYDNWQSSPDEL